MDPKDGLGLGLQKASTHSLMPHLHLYDNHNNSQTVNDKCKCNANLLVGDGKWKKWRLKKEKRDI